MKLSFYSGECQCAGFVQGNPGQAADSRSRGPHRQEWSCGGGTAERQCPQRISISDV